MITCDLFGGLGNQMFMAAAAIAHANRTETSWGVPEYTIDNRVWKNQLPRTVKRIAHGGHIPVWNEPLHAYSEIPLTLRHARLHGYFQSYKYFEDYDPEIRAAFGFTNTAGINAVSLHIRRGDYLLYSDKHPPVTLDYVRRAIEMFPSDPFIVFSDDISWCHKNLKGDRFHFAEAGNPPMVDMKAMALCKHNIISNSTFSWWAAYMNINPEKIVVTPDESNWFGPANKHLDVSTLIPNSWTRIKY